VIEQRSCKVDLVPVRDRLLEICLGSD